VDEQSQAEGASPASRILIETEQAVLAWPTMSVIVGRAAGIYGPGRGHLFKQFLRNEAVLRGDGSHWMNMIHVEDAAAAIAHLIQNGTPGAIYNLTDDEPVTQLEFFQWLSERLQKPLPPSAPPDNARKRGLTNKRVSNACLKQTGYRFLYPNYRSGYAGEIQAAGK
jgi:nucleoside-diphosphate-sugar epimerase